MHSASHGLGKNPMLTSAIRCGCQRTSVPCCLATLVTDCSLFACSQVLPNMTIMLQQLALNYAAGQVMWAYNTLMLLAFMLDPRLTGAVPGPNPNLDPNGPARAALGLAGLPQLLDLVIAYEERLRTAAQKEASQRMEGSSDSGSDSGSRSASDADSEADSESRSIRDVSVQVDSSLGSESDAEPRLASPAASLGPLLIKMQNGIAATLTGIAEELQSLQWLIDRLQADASLSPEVCLHSFTAYTDMPALVCYVSVECAGSLMHPYAVTACTTLCERDLSQMLHDGKAEHHLNFALLSAWCLV